LSTSALSPAEYVENRGDALQVGLLPSSTAVDEGRGLRASRSKESPMEAYVYQEEGYLERRFGDTYRDYKARVRRWV
jgi:hypothetical protein